MVFRISATQFFPDIVVRPFPEAGKVLRHLYRPFGGRQEMEHQRNSPARDTRRVLAAEHLLQTYFQHRRLGLLVINRETGATWNSDVGWGQAVKAAQLFVRQ